MFENVRTKIGKALMEVAKEVAFLLPPRVAYWAAIRVWAFATMGEWVNDDDTVVTCMTAIQRYGDKGGKHDDDH